METNMTGQAAIGNMLYWLVNFEPGKYIITKMEKFENHHPGYRGKMISRPTMSGISGSRGASSVEAGSGASAGAPHERTLAAGLRIPTIPDRTIRDWNGINILASEQHRPKGCFLNAYGRCLQALENANAGSHRNDVKAVHSKKCKFFPGLSAPLLVAFFLGFFHFSVEKEERERGHRRWLQPNVPKYSNKSFNDSQTSTPNFQSTTRSQRANGEDRLLAAWTVANGHHQQQPCWLPIKCNRFALPLVPFGWL